MVRALTFISLFVFCSFVSAHQKSALYQVDLIAFTHHNTGDLSSSEQTASTALASAHAIPLKINGSKTLSPYHTLPAASSQLRNEYWALHRKAHYQILLHYSWLQPGNNQSAILLPTVDHHGWSLSGTLRVRKSNYYLLDTDLLFSSPDQGKTFSFNQKQRLKAGEVYYLDHPQVGLLIKVHKIS